MISPLAYVSPKAQIGKNVTIDAFAYIDDNVILGDNCAVKEYGIKDSDILAVMTSFIRNDREYSVKDLAYKIYSFVWLKTAPIRIYLRLKIIPVIKKLIKS